MTGRGFVVTVLAVASVLVIVAYGATWVTATVPMLAGATSPQDPVATVDLSGSELVPLGRAMGWVGLAAVAALLATRRWGRRVTGFIVALAGGVAGATALSFALTDAVSGGPGTFVAAALDARAAGQPIAWQASPWWIAAVAGGMGMLACGVVALVVGPSWPALSSRYSRSASQDHPLSSASAWDALDRGEDPTADREAVSPAQPGSMEAVADHEEDR